MKLFQSNKGQTGMPRGINLILAIIVAGVGVLNMFGTVIGFSLPAIPSMILYGLIALAGLMALLDGFIGVGMSGIMPKKVNISVGLLVLASGALLLLGQFGIFSIPAIPNTVIYILLIIGGGIMLLDGILGASNYST